MKRYFTLFAIVTFAFAFNSCNKKGCSDPTADNYVKKVKKARDNKCEYNGEGICGVGIQFCFDRDGITQKSGSATFEAGIPGADYKRIVWTSGTFGSANYQDVIIEINGNEEASYSLSQNGQNKTFKAEYYDGNLNNAFAATNGSLTIKKDNSNDGLIATFSFTTTNGTQIKNGNIYKLK